MKRLIRLLLKEKTDLGQSTCGIGQLRNICCLINPLYTGNPSTGTLANSEDPDEMQHNAAFHQGLHCLFR